MKIEEIILRPIEDTDIDSLYSLLNDSANQQLVGGSEMPMSKSQVFDWLQDKRDAKDICQFAIDQKGVFCGYAQLASINTADGHATLGINICNQFQGKGLGGLVLKLVHDFVRNRLLLHKIILYVRSDNQPALSLYNKLGYRKAGTLTRHVKTLKGYVDLEIMELML